MSMDQASLLITIPSPQAINIVVLTVAPFFLKPEGNHEPVYLVLL